MKNLKKRSGYQWFIEPSEKMRVPFIIFGDDDIIKNLDEKVYEQGTNVASLPGIVKASFAMPDAHWGYGFPIGGVAAFDPDKGGVISAGGVGFDISCGVRTILTGLKEDQIESVKDRLADELARHIPAGVGSTGRLNLSKDKIDEMLAGGVKWAVERGYGTQKDLQRTEENGIASGAVPAYVSDKAKERQKEEVGTLGSGNHYLEVQKVIEIFDAEIANAYNVTLGDIVVTIHCGSRGLGHQVATDYMPRMLEAAKEAGIELPERDLACAPINSSVGKQYYGAMRAGINCAIANRQVLTHLVREAFDKVLPQADLKLLYDVSHNTCKVEEHKVDGKSMKLYIHRKGATRAFGPGHPALPQDLRDAGQPVLIGGTMGTFSYILAGMEESEDLCFSSCSHGAGRAMSRTQATKKWSGREVVKSLAQKGIIIKSASMKGIAEEAPGAYKDVVSVADATEKAHLAKRVAKLAPLICVKG
ncbi:MAG: RtcB family protein [Sedimentisphaerales bacterium]|nr:RtcB family protein [Sedimentisphaerales bacterium]